MKRRHAVIVGAVGLVAAFAALPDRSAAQESGGSGAQVEGPRVDVPPPRLNLRRQDVDLDNRVVRYSISRKALRNGSRCVTWLPMCM